MQYSGLILCTQLVLHVVADDDDDDAAGPDKTGWAHRHTQLYYTLCTQSHILSPIQLLA